MSIQDDINLVGSLLPIITAGAAFIPGVGPAVAAAGAGIAIAEDGIKLEQATVTWLNSPEGAKAKGLIGRLTHRLGMAFDAAAGVIKPETRDEVQTDLDAGRF